MRIIITIPCDHCGKRFRRYASEQRKNKAQKYCSKKCLIEYRRLPEYWFWPRVKKTATCWLWQGAMFGNGYGSCAHWGEGRHLVHRAAYRLLVGEIPDRLLVLHRCDVRNCVNPDHLFVGTHADNTRDMVAKGRNRSQHIKCPPHSLAR